MINYLHNATSYKLMNWDYRKYFPKESYYQNQLDAMKSIYEALIKKQIVLFEGACGTGKTLSALVPALHIAKMEKKTVVIATSVHQQMAQFIEEAREIKKQTDIKIVPFIGKMRMCPKPNMDEDKCNLLTDNTYKLIEIEKNIWQLSNEINLVNEKIKLQKDTGLIELKRILSLKIDKEKQHLDEVRKNSCDLLLEFLKHDKDYFHDWIFSGVRTPEEVKEWALSNNCCGYELLKRHMQEANLLICNYNHFLDEGIRANVLGWMGKSLKDIILIFDEAHNIEDKAREHSIKLKETDIKRAIDEIDAIKYPLFCWDEIPGNDDSKLVEFLRSDFSVNWIELPKILKTDNDKTINVSDGNKTIWLRLDDESNEVRLGIDEIYKYNIKKYNNKTYIYKNILPSEDFVPLLSVLLDTLKSTYNDRIRLKNAIIDREWQDLRIVNPELDIKERIDVFKNNFINALEQVGIKNLENTIERMKEFGYTINVLYEKQFTEGKNQIKKRSYFLLTAEFLSNYMAFSNDIKYYPNLSVKRQNNEIYGRLELYSCIPKNVTAPLFNNLHAAVLMSATLTPFDTTKKTLGITRETCERAFGLTFPKENRLTLTASVPSLLHNNRDEPEIYNLIKRVSNDIIEQSDGNVIIFFQNSTEARRYKERIKCNVPVFLDKKGDSAHAHSIKDEFFRIGESGKKAVLLSYIGGTLTEGVDYKDNRCRTVVIVGVGYPSNRNDKMIAVESANEEEFGDGWKYTFAIPTIRKVRQAMGRVIRSKEDYGVRVLLDERYTSESVKSKGKSSVYDIFPEEERNEFVDVEPEQVKDSIRDFFNNIRELKNKPLIQEKERLQAETAEFEQKIKNFELDKIILETKLKLFEDKLTKINILEEAKELKERKELLIQEREQLKSEVERVKHDNLTQNANLKSSEEELTKIGKLIEDINSYINSARCYSTPKKIDNDPSIEKRAKRYYEKEAKRLGLSGKSSSELQLILEIHKNKESELKKEIDTTYKNNKQLSILKEKISTNDKHVNEIDIRLSLLELQCIKEINENELNSIKERKHELILNIKRGKDLIDEINSQLKILRDKISSNNARVLEIDKKLQSISIAKG